MFILDFELKMNPICIWILAVTEMKIPLSEHWAEIKKKSK